LKEREEGGEIRAGRRGDSAFSSGGLDLSRNNGGERN
jgi:hypothetical protein